MNKAIKRLLMMTKSIPLYEYRPDGIYLNYGPYKGTSLTLYYKNNKDNCLEYLENIIDSDWAPFKIKEQTKSVIKDLKNNYPNYEIC
jgi:hypothetical protein